MVKVRRVKGYLKFQSLSLAANHEVILIPGQLVKCFRTLCKESTAAYPPLQPPTNEKPRTKRGLSEHFLSALRLRRLEVSLHNPSRKLRKAMLPAHSLTSTLQRTHDVAHLAILLYANYEEMSTGKIFLWDRENGAFLFHPPQSHCKNETTRRGTHQREVCWVILL